MIDRLIIVVKLLIPILGIALIFYISYLVFEGWDSVTAEWIRLIGRLQEMGREINTMGSKANHADIQKWVVRMKDELEKIKEQSLNIL